MKVETLSLAIRTAASFVVRSVAALCVFIWILSQRRVAAGRRSLSPTADREVPRIREIRVITAKKKKHKETSETVRIV